MKIPALSAIFFFGCTYVQGQHAQLQYLYWLRYQNQLVISPLIYLNNEADNRRFFNPDVQNQFIFHSRIHYKKNPWDIGVGLTYSLAYASKPQAPNPKPVAEIRPVMEATHELRMRKFYLQNRVRIDNRFFETNSQKNILEESFFVMRYRYRLQARIPLRKKEGLSIPDLRMANEIMFNSKKNTFDQNRIYLTADWFISKHLSIETGYIFIYQQRFGTEEFFSRHVLRFSILHKIKIGAE